MISLRPSRFDELGLRRALSDRMVSLLVAAMALLAAFALAGWFGTAALSRHWQQGAGASLTVQVPRPGEPASRGDQTRLSVVLALLTGTPGVVTAHALSDQELADLLRPWLGQAGLGQAGPGQGGDHLSVPVPGVIAVRLTSPTTKLDPLSRRLSEVAPGTVLEDHGVWIGRLAVLVGSLQACAGLAVLLVACVAAAVIAVATRAGLSTHRDAIEIIHGLGATDSYIASRFASRAMLLASTGALLGTIGALPILLTLAHFAAPFAADPGAAGDMAGPSLAALPASLWLSLPCLPVVAAAIGYATAHGTVRHWLRRLP